MSASAAGLLESQMAGTPSFTWSLVRPESTEVGKASMSQSGSAASSRLWMSSHCSWSLSCPKPPFRPLVRTMTQRPASRSP